MAFASDSTTPPALQPRLLRPIPGRQAFTPALAATESTAAQPYSVSDLAPKEALASTAAKPLLPPADRARALHMRRELHQALDHGFALLDALDLPPLALDVIDDAIATLDALEAPDEDREDDGGIEDDDPAEPDEDHGSDDVEDIGHHASHYAPRPLTVAARAEIAVMAARARAMRRTLHV